MQNHIRRWVRGCALGVALAIAGCGGGDADAPQALEAPTVLQTGIAVLAGNTGQEQPPPTPTAWTSMDRLAADVQGNVYLADGWTRRVFRIDATGAVSALVRLPGELGGDPGGLFGSRFTSPTGVEAAPDGTLYIPDRATATVWKLPPGGSLDTLPGIAPSTDVTTASPLPRMHGVLDVTLAADGTLVFARELEIVKRAPDGTLSTVAVPFVVMDIALAPDGTVYAACHDPATGFGIYAISPSGGFTAVPGPADVRTVATDAKGNLYAGSGGMIFRRTPAGDWSAVAGTPNVTHIGTGPLPGTLAAVRHLAVMPTPLNTVGTRLVVGSANAVVLVTLPE